MTQLIENVIELVKVAGREIEIAFREESSSILDVLDDNPSTSIDKKSHQILEKGLRKIGEGPILSEEDNSRHVFNLTDEPYWVIDPLDGTREFIDRNQEFTISVALIKMRVPQIGVVYNPITKELFYAQKGEGAFKNGKRVKGRDPNKQGPWLISRSDYKKGLFKNWKGSLLRPMGSIAYKLAKAGFEESCSGVISLTPKSLWDYVGGALIASEMGFEIFDFEGKSLIESINKIRIPNLIAAYSNSRQAVLKQVQNFYKTAK